VAYPLRRRVRGKGTEIAEAKSDASGNLAFSFKTPDDLGGAHTISVTDGNTKKTGTAW